MSKRYILKKDLPDLMAEEDVVFERVGDVTMPTNREYSFSRGDRRWHYPIQLVENSPNWFEEIVELERIEVRKIEDTDVSMLYHFWTTTPISQDKFTSIKEAIEGVLNPKLEASHTPAPGSKDWEVECFTGMGANYWRQKNGGYHSKPFNDDISEKHFLDHPEVYSIHSVRRLSDNTTWTVGEYAGDKYSIHEFKIEKFHIVGSNDIKVTGVETSLFLSSLKKLPPKPQPLFVKKPPLGLKPRFIHDEQRLDEINAAIRRYLTEWEEPIPSEWLVEKMELENKSKQ